MLFAKRNTPRNPGVWLLVTKVIPQNPGFLCNKKLLVKLGKRRKTLWVINVRRAHETPALPRNHHPQLFGGAAQPGLAAGGGSGNHAGMVGSAAAKL
jgi:hypothetical protein